MSTKKIILTSAGYSVLIGTASMIDLELGIGVGALVGLFHSMTSILRQNSEVIVLEDSESKTGVTQKKAKQTVERKAAKNAISGEKTSQKEVGLDRSVFAQFQNNLNKNLKEQKPAKTEAQKSVPNTTAQKSPNPDPASSAKALSSKPPRRDKEKLSPTQPQPLLNKTQLPTAKTEGAPKKQVQKEKQEVAPTQDSLFEQLLNEENVKEPLVPKDKVTISQKTLVKAKEPNAEQVPSPNPASTSSKATIKPAPPAPKKLPGTKTPEELLQELVRSSEAMEMEDLFADVRIPLSAEYSRKEPYASEREAGEDWFDEGLGAALDNRMSKDEQLAEAQALQKMAETAFMKQHWDGARASMDNCLTILKDLKQDPDWESLFLYTKICVKQGDLAGAKTRLPQLMSQGLQPQHPDYVSVMEELASALEENGAFEEALPILQDLLKYYRQQLDRIRMDRIYERIESAFEQLGEDERLIRSYKNHLEIKRVLNDPDGESRLLDLIGNRYYKMGEKELSRQFYEDNLKLKSAMEKI
ncbi:hypothetical protein WDW89_03580 [Deltaproteobacteria bacterium TL4]